MNHAPNCTDQTTTTERGHSVIVTRCNGCGAITTERRMGN